MIKRKDIEYLNKEELIKLVQLLNKKIYYMTRYNVYDEVYRNTKDRAAEIIRDSYLDARIKVNKEITEIFNKNKVNRRKQLN